MLKTTLLDELPRISAELKVLTISKGVSQSAIESIEINLLKPDSPSE